MKSQEFIIQSFDPDFLFTGEFGDDAPTPTDDSYGGLQITSIPKRMGITEYTSQNPMGLQIPFIVDRVNEGDMDYVEHQFKQLSRLAGRSSKDDFEPPVCIVDGHGRIPHDHTFNPHIRWQVEGLTWDPALFINGRIAHQDGKLRIGGVVTLREYNVDEVLGDYRGPAAKNRKRHKDKNKDKSGKGKQRRSRGGHYTIKSGDTLISIASRELGDSKRWREIADLNNIRNPRELKIGQRLRMPK